MEKPAVKNAAFSTITGSSSHFRFNPTGPQKLIYGKDGFWENIITAKRKTVITSDQALTLEFVPGCIAIIGCGYIGFEFSNAYTALGSEVTIIEAMDQIMPGLYPEIGKLAQGVLMNPHKIDYYTGVFASKINVVTQDGFIPVDERMRVMGKDGKLVPNLYCIGDATGRMMFGHAASMQGISVVEQIMGRDHFLNHLSIPEVCFTHPEISSVGLTEEIQIKYAIEEKKKEGHFEEMMKKLRYYVISIGVECLVELLIYWLALIIFDIFRQ